MKRFTFIIGDDSFLVNERARAWFDQQTEGAEDPFNHDRIDGMAQTVAEAESAINQFTESIYTLSLFGKRVVWLKDAGFLGDNVVGRSKSVQVLLDKLKGHLETVDPNQTAVLISTASIDRRRSFSKWCEANSECIRIELKGEDALRRMVQQKAAALQLKASEDALQALIERVQGSTRVLMTELEKCALYQKDRPEALSVDDVLDLVPPFGESDFFEPVEALYSKSLHESLAALNRYFFHHKESRPLLASLQNRNRLLIQMKALQEAGLLHGRVSKATLEGIQAQFGSHFSPNGAKSSYRIFSQNPFYFGRLLRCLDRFTLKAFINLQQGLTIAFKRCVEQPAQQETILRTLFISFTSAS